MLDFIQNSIASAIDRWFAGVGYSFAKWMLDWGVQAMSIHESFFQQAWLNSAYGIVIQIATAWLVARSVWEATNIYVLRSAGESHTDPQVWFRRVIFAVLGVSLSGTFVRTMIQVASGTAKLFGEPKLDRSFGQAIAEQLLCNANGGAVSDVIQCGSNAIIGGSLGGVAGVAAMPVLLAVVFLVAFAVAVFFLYLQALVRTWELAVAYVVGPVFALSAMGTDHWLSDGMYALWVREVSVLTLTQVIHSILLNGVVSHFTSSFSLGSFFAALIGLYVAWTVPRILRNFTYSSGVSRMATTMGGHFVTHLLTRAMW